jgi:hypothetical protein
VSQRHQSADGEAQRRVLLRVTGLEGPPIGGGCCAISPEDLVLDELDSWPGLLTSGMDPDAGTVQILVSDEDDLAYALEALHDRGLPATVVDEEAHPTGRPPGTMGSSALPQVPSPAGDHPDGVAWFAEGVT